MGQMGQSRMALSFKGGFLLFYLFPQKITAWGVASGFSSATLTTWGTRGEGNLPWHKLRRNGHVARNRKFSIEWC